MEVSAESTHKPMTHPQYRQIAIIINIGVLLVGIFDYFTGRPASAMFNIEANVAVAIFCVMVLLLGGLEFLRPYAAQYIGPGVHLLIMVILSGVALAMSRHHYSQLLLLVAILFAAITFSRWIANLTSALSLLLIFLRGALASGENFLSVFDMNAILIFTVLMLLILMMARLIKSEWSNHLHVQTLNEEIKETSAQLAHMAAVEERNRMARDIHDSIGHHLAAVTVQLQMAEKLHQRDPDASRAAIHQAQAATHDALRDVRQSVGALRPSDETFALVPAVELLIDRIASDDLAINYQLDGDEKLYPQPTRIVFFRAIQEGLTNVYKHATASHVNLWLQFLPQQARLRIIDDGIGFDTHQHTVGTGLRGVRERVENLGGSVVIESRPNEGTVLDITLPQPSFS